MFLQQPDALHDAVEGAFAPFILPVAIVNLPGSIQADADEEVVCLEKRAPGIVQPHTIGLQAVPDLLLLPVGFLEFDHPAEEIDAQEGRLATVPHELDHGRRLGLHVLPDVRVQHLIGHTIVFAAIEQGALL